ncbi:MAG: hypothetical protein HY785_24570 [Oscillatoriophycideae cyanobacterium NC_groundwater_1537_Pr4_S-0.65um_50_18]|nr:hypothetical protein [Oscillatoriophycideae cyanobacterium NC_groundwater_1537_Pr4_S-0.65um_50_18]
MTQPHILELAKQGDPEAIALLMNQSLQPRGMTATVERQEDLLEVVLEAERVPSREALTAFVQKGIANLGVESIRFVRIVGQQSGAMLPAWMQELDLAIAMPDLDTELAVAVDPDPADRTVEPDLIADPDGQTDLSADLLAADTDLGIDLSSLEESPLEEPAPYRTESEDLLLEDALLGEPSLEDALAIAPEESPLLFNEFAEDTALPESLPDTLDFAGLDFEEPTDVPQPLSTDPEQQQLEAQLASLWAEQSAEPSQDFDLSLDAEEPISEAEFQDLFAEEAPEVSSVPDELPERNSSTEIADLFAAEESDAAATPTADLIDADLSPDFTSMDDLFGEEPSSEDSLELPTQDLFSDDAPVSIAESDRDSETDFFLDAAAIDLDAEPETELTTDLFLDEPDGSFDLALSDSSETADSDVDSALDLFADSSSNFETDITIPDVSIPDVSIPDVAIPDVTIPDVSEFSETPALEDSFQDLLADDASEPADSLQDLLTEESSDFSLDWPTEETPADTAIADLFSEESADLQPDLLDSDLSFTESTSESADSWLAEAELSTDPLADPLAVPDFFAELNETSEASLEPQPDLLDSDLSFTESTSESADSWLAEAESSTDPLADPLAEPDFFAELNETPTGLEEFSSPAGAEDELQPLSDPLFTEDLQGLTEDPIEYVFGDPTVDPIAQTTEPVTEPTLEPQQDLPLPLLEEQLDNLWAETDEHSFELEEEPLFDRTEASDPSEDLFAEQLLPEEPIDLLSDEPDLFLEQSELELESELDTDLSLAALGDSLQESTSEVDDLLLFDEPLQDNPADLSDDNAILLDLPSGNLFSEDPIAADLPIASEEFSLDASDDPLSDPSESLFQEPLEHDSEESILDEADLLATLSLEDLGEEPDPFLEDSGQMQEDLFSDEVLSDDTLIDNAIADLPTEFLSDLDDSPLDNAVENSLAIDSLESAEADASPDLLDFSDFSDNTPDEPLASLMHETSPDDLGIEFLDANDEDLTTTAETASQPVPELSDANDFNTDDNDLDLPLDFLDDRRTGSSLQGFSGNNLNHASSDLENDLELDSDFLNLPPDLLDQPDEEAIDFLVDDLLVDSDDLSIDAAVNAAVDAETEETATDFPNWDEEFTATQSLEDRDFSTLDEELDQDLNQDIANLSLSVEPEDYFAEEANVASTVDEQALEEEWIDPLNDEVETRREIDLPIFTESSIEPSIEPVWESSTNSSELSQEQLEAQLEEFDRDMSSEAYVNQGYSQPEYGNGGRDVAAYTAGNGQGEGYLPPALVSPESSGTSWIFSAVLIGVSGLVAGLLGYSLWSEIASPPAPQPSIVPTPEVPAPEATSPVLPSAPPAEPAAPAEPPV